MKKPREVLCVALALSCSTTPKEPTENPDIPRLPAEEVITCKLG